MELILSISIRSGCPMVPESIFCSISCFFSSFFLIRLDPFTFLRLLDLVVGDNFLVKGRWFPFLLLFNNNESLSSIIFLTSAALLLLYKMVTIPLLYVCDRIIYIKKLSWGINDFLDCMMVLNICEYKHYILSRKYISKKETT